MLFVKLATLLSSAAIFVHVASALAITVDVDAAVATLLEDATGPVTVLFDEVNLLATDSIHIARATHKETYSEEYLEIEYSNPNQIRANSDLRCPGFKYPEGWLALSHKLPGLCIMPSMGDILGMRRGRLENQQEKEGDFLKP
ncbi:hypothetical protein C8R45DRAFT_922704 [Mycena sanguinolenta]|nr:hypothetical protein C8R45DRAFT_922704 [Mycena sanguinolenta]